MGKTSYPSIRSPPRAEASRSRKYESTDYAETGGPVPRPPLFRASAFNSPCPLHLNGKSPHRLGKAAGVSLL